MTYRSGKKWTAKELGGMDDVTFAMHILSERHDTLTPGSQLSRKIESAFKTLDGLRGGKTLQPGQELDDIGFRMHMEAEALFEESLLKQILAEGIAGDYGLSEGDVTEGSGLFGDILRRYGKCESNESENMHYAISQVLGDAEAKRKGGVL